MYLVLEEKTHSECNLPLHRNGCHGQHRGNDGHVGHEGAHPTEHSAKYPVPRKKDYEKLKINIPHYE